MNDIINEKATIYSLEEAPLCDARLINIDDDIVNLVYFNEIPIRLREDVIISIATDLKGILMYRCKVLEVKDIKTKILKKKQFSGKFKILELYQNIQRRQDFKIRVFIPTEITLLDIKKEIIIDPETENPITHSVNIKDLSANGVLLSSDEKLSSGQLFNITFTQTKKPFTVVGEVLRVQPDFHDHIGYGCRFVDLSKDQEALIRQFVFRMQIKQEKG